jgi:cytochrome P450
METTVTITGHAEAHAVLVDPRFTVPPLPPEASAGLMGWLREHVGRFSTGEAHARRRGYAVTVLAGIDPMTLRRRATELADNGRPPEQVPVIALAEALGVPCAEKDAAVDAVATVARGYFPGTDAGAAGEAAVAYLIGVFGGAADEPTAARIGLLAQACQATAGLITNALRGSAALEATLRDDPPVRALRRQNVASGAIVEIDVAAANRDAADGHLTFGAGPRECPGREHALAIAVGVVEAVRG